MEKIKIKINGYDIAELFDDGWRSEDHDDLMSKYHMTDEESAAICGALKIYEYTITETVKNALRIRAIRLYDGGWRASDRERLISEYELFGEDADVICDTLKSIEEREYNK